MRNGCNAKTNSSMPVTAVPVSPDNVIRKPEFMQLQRLTGRHFTRDACASNDGSNAMCPKYSSPPNSFLHESCAGHHVWMHPPRDRIEEFLRHYLRCKTFAPTSTSGGFLLPKWAHTRWRPLLAGMQKLHEFQEGYHLFTAQTVKSKTCEWCAV